LFSHMQAYNSEQSYPSIALCCGDLVFIAVRY
jgi:hypothetical protein